MKGILISGAIGFAGLTLGAPPAFSSGSKAPSKPQLECLITADGIGPIRLGTTLDAARRAFPSARFERTTDGEGLALVEVVVGDDRWMQLYADEEDPEAPIDFTLPISFIETFFEGCKTPEGVHPGSPIGDAIAHYGAVAKIVRSEIESREYVTFEKQAEHLDLRLDHTGIFPEGSAETKAHAPEATILSIAVSGP
jgi:hypothetical protein